MPSGVATASRLPSGLISIWTIFPLLQCASGERWLRLSIVIAFCGSARGVPASTEGGGVTVAVGNACVGNGVIVGAGGGGVAQAVIKSRNASRVHGRLFIFHSFPRALNYMSLMMRVFVFDPAWM